VCPYTILGCEETCLRSNLPRHLDECKFRPRSRQEEDAEREKHRAYALEAEEIERVRRLGETNYLGSQDSQARISLLQAIAKNVEPESGDVAQLRLVLRRRRASWVVQVRALSFERILSRVFSPPRRLRLSGCGTQKNLLPSPATRRRLPSMFLLLQLWLTQT